MYSSAAEKNVKKSERNAHSDGRWEKRCHLLPVSVQCGRGIGPYEPDEPPEADT